jgi:1,4-alpha-glucan branching enzyme
MYNIASTSDSSFHKPCFRKPEIWATSKKNCNLLIFFTTNVFILHIKICRMKKLLLSICVVLLCVSLNGQLLTWSPQFPLDNSTITVTLDATKGNKALDGFAGPVYMHLGVITSASTTSTDWRYVPTTWASTTAPQATAAGANKWTFTITNPRAFFNAANGGVPASETILRVALLFRNADGSKVHKNTDNSDMYVPIYAAGSNNIVFTNPPLVPNFNTTNETAAATLGQPMNVTATASTTGGTLNLFFNGNLIAGPITNAASISGAGTPTTSGTQRFVAQLTVGNTTVSDTIQFFIAPPNVILPLPAGVQEGINYWPGCDSVTLVLYAPNKLNAVVLGDFAANTWAPQTNYQMNRTPDGNNYWITLRGLTPGQEYAFQYLVDNSIYIADPYAEKVLDPWNDRFIPTATFPNLKPYPTDPNVSSGTNGYISILQTCPTQYVWKTQNFVKPNKRHLVTYELLVRDFGDARNYQMLIDSLPYFKRLGVNSIQLMPVNEFSGNESWGYNPVFYLALDKAYGTKDKFKEFIDSCHQNGIAVLLDVVYNHLDAFNAPQGRLYWDAANGRPAVGNPWLNLQAPHPYSVFEDLNHSATTTRSLVRRAFEYWIKEYKIDGFRLDLAKGFTQKATNETTVEDFDGGRLSNLYHYYDYVNNNFPGTYMILEFLGQQRTEENQYANKGYLLWSKITDQYNQATMGYSTGSDFSKVIYNSSQTAFIVPAAQGYMESHDEERLMFKNISFGRNESGFNLKDTTQALLRMAAAATVFFTTPGPKLLWQFGERGYDVSINFNGGRTANKPHNWAQWTEPRRKRLFDVYAKLINLRVANAELFNSTNFQYDFSETAGLFKRMQIMDNAANGLRITAIANMDVVPITRTIGLQATGEWMHYVSNGTGAGLNGGENTLFTVNDFNQSVTLQPGEYHVYLYHPANVYVFNGSGNWNDAANWTYNRIPPANLPSGAEIMINPRMGGECILNIAQTIGQGAKITVMAGKKIQIPLNLSIQ